MSSILDLIPQRAPMVMIDEFLGEEEGVSRTAFLIRGDNLFVDGGEFSECGVIEHIAQSAAARVGARYVECGEAVPLGYIASVNNFEMLRTLSVGERLETEVSVIQEVFGITLVEVRCYVSGELVARCRMKTVVDSDAKRS